MKRFSILFLGLLGLPLSPVVAQPASPAKKAEPIFATVETTLASAPNQIRQFAFDGDPNTYFASEKNPTKSDHFTLVFDKPVAVKSISATTGKPKGEDKLDSGELQVSTDGKTFESAAKFSKGSAHAKFESKMLLAVRIQPTSDLKHILAIREIAVDSEPAITPFHYPVEYIIDVSEAPELKEWLEKSAKICEHQYGIIAEFLKSKDYRPPQVVRMTMKKDYDGVAFASGSRIVGSAKFFTEHPKDFGAMVHETVHVIQSYRGQHPGWLAEGIADYVRFYIYEPGKAGKVNAAKAKFDGSYRTTASFLNYVAEKYKKDLVPQLNARLREGKYKEEAFQEITGKTVKDLDEEWRMSLRK